MKEAEENQLALSKEREALLKQRDSALQEAHLWHSELGKAREHAVILEAAVLRAEERARVSEADAATRVKDAAEKLVVAAKEKEELLAVVNLLQSQVRRQQSSTKKFLEERSESSSGSADTKHVDSYEDDIEKACLSDSKMVPVPGDSELHLAVDRVEIHERIADVREISPETQVDISVVSPQVEDH